MEKLKGEKELNSVIVYGQESNKLTGHEEKHNNSQKDEDMVYSLFCNLPFEVLSI